MRSSSEARPRERRETLRRKLQQMLEQGRGFRTARNLAGELGVTEQEVCRHLEHLEKTVRQERKRLRMEPAQCRKCGFVFSKRSKYKKPSRCPACRSEYLDPPGFLVEEL
jgi:hypothetical protein